ncbi:MAG: bifunctional riboflavin kinase/FAD synthetase [Cytophagales bacterium]|nr:bifunctional riboflavin kinase/FAD synthetase [Armatimonadota bacterium]
MTQIRSSHALYRLDTLKPGGLPPLAVAIGVFDGVHLGHQALLADAREAAAKTGATPAALTFDPHPAAIFAPGRVPPMLGTLEERIALLHRHGAEVVVVASFDRVLAAQTPGEFARRILRDTLQARAVIVGGDFRFGCDRTGDIVALRALGAQEGFAVQVVPPVFVHGVPARSTGIRQMVGGGQMAEATRLLGRPYTLSGMVVHGRKLGRTLGYPTANVESAPAVLVPGAGVYACRVRLEDGTLHRAAVSVGTNQTIAPDAPRTVEAFLMDGFSGDLYDQRMAVEFVQLLRPMLKFDGLDALVAQMARDVDEAAGFLG